MRVRLKLIIAFVVSLGFLEATIVIAGVNDEQGGRAKVLIIGDSVFDAFDHVVSAREQLDSQQKTIFAVQGCQKLVEPGCFLMVRVLMRKLHRLLPKRQENVSV